MRNRINPENPQLRLVRHVVDCLKQGGVVLYPTDTTYGLGCDIFNPKGIKKIYQINSVIRVNLSLLFVVIWPKYQIMPR